MSKENGISVSSPACKGLRVILCQIRRQMEADTNLSRNNEILFGYFAEHRR